MNVSICKYSDDCYYININSPIVSQNKKLLIVMDNFNYPLNILPEIIYNSAPILYNYLKFINDVQLLTIYPNCTVKNITNDNIFTEFKNIIHGKLIPENEAYNQLYQTMIESYLKIVNANQNINFDVMMIVDYQRMKAIYRDIDKLTKMKNVNEIKVLDKNKYSTLDTNGFIYTNIKDSHENNFYRDFILGNNKKEVTINLKDGYLFDSHNNEFKIDIYKHNTLIVNERISRIKIDSYEYNLEETEFNYTTFLDGIYTYIELNYKELKRYIDIKNFILNKIKNYENIETKNKADIIYQIFKRKIDIVKIINQSLVDIEDKNIIEYASKSYNFNPSQKVDNILIKKISNNIFQKKIIKNSNNQTKIENFIGKYESSDDEKFLISCDFFTSPLTLSNWFDEIESNGCMGILLNIHITPLCKLGYIDEIKFKEISSSFMPVQDFINMTVDYFNKKKNGKYGDLNKKEIIKGEVIGQSNAVIPLYINKYHWMIVKNYLDSLLGIIISHNPLSFTKNHYTFYFLLIKNFSMRLFYQDNFLNEKNIKIFMALYRTCAELCFENNFNRGIRKVIHDKINLGNCHYDKILIQSLVTGYILSKEMLDELFVNCLSDVIKIHNIKIDLQENDSDEEITAKINMIKPIIYDKSLSIIETFYCSFKLNQIMDQIIKYYGSFNQLIKNLDSNFGIIDTYSCDLLINFIKENKFNIQSLDDFLNEFNIELEIKNLNIF